MEKKEENRERNWRKQFVLPTKWNDLNIAAARRSFDVVPLFFTDATLDRREQVFFQPRDQGGGKITRRIYFLLCVRVDLTCVAYSLPLIALSIYIRANDQSDILVVLLVS